jgi:hypothetical protein
MTVLRADGWRWFEAIRNVFLRAQAWKQPDNPGNFFTVLRLLIEKHITYWLDPAPMIAKMTVMPQSGLEHGTSPAHCTLCHFPRWVATRDDTVLWFGLWRNWKKSWKTLKYYGKNLVLGQNCKTNPLTPAKSIWALFNVLSSILDFNCKIWRSSWLSYSQKKGIVVCAIPEESWIGLLIRGFLSLIGSIGLSVSCGEKFLICMAGDVCIWFRKYLTGQNST